MKVEIEAEALIKIIDALEFYANPDVYWACSFMFDRPTGGFDDDFSDFQEYKDFLDGSTPDCYYEDRERPGLNARKVLRALITNHRDLLAKLVDIEHKEQ